MVSVKIVLLKVSGLFQEKRLKLEEKCNTNKELIITIFVTTRHVVRCEKERSGPIDPLIFLHQL